MKPLFFILFALILVGCASSHNSSNATQTWHRDYKNYLAAQADFDSLAGEPLSSKYDDVISVKVIWNLKDDQLYFINSKYFRYHHEFADKHFNQWNTVQTFNATNYHTNFMQEFCLGNLNYSSQNNSYSLELSSTASYQATQINQFFNKVSEALQFSDKFKFLVSSDHLLSIKESLEIPQVSVSEFFGDQPFQVINEGQTCGKLVFLDSEKDHYKISTSDIVIVHGSPTSIPLCRAIISDQVQSPLSHVQLLSKNRKIPSISISNKKLFSELMEHINQVIELNVEKDTYVILASDSSCILNNFVRPEVAVTLDFKLEPKRLLNGKELSFKNKAAIGNKAAGFGELQKMANEHNADFFTPEGAFGIPFYFFSQHMKDSTLQSMLEDLKMIEQPYADTLAYHLLRDIRKRVKSLPISKDLLNRVNSELMSSKFKSFRFRSSCNAEDLPDFNGAGLYTSKSAILGDTSKTVEKAIKAVWASLYNDQAYIERWSKNVDESSVFMGILVHRSFPDEDINGVVISSNIYRSNSPGFTCNLQKGDNKVVSPDENTISEQCVVSSNGMFIDRDDSKTIDFISFSSESPDSPLLAKEQYELLYDAIYQIKSKMYFKKFGNHKVEFNDYSLDLEFKFDNNGKLYIKQVRPA